MTAPENVGPVHGALWVEGNERLGKSVEVARLWVEDGGPATFVIQPNNIDGPEMFGMLMTDCLRHAARAFLQALNITEGEALDRIFGGLDSERDEPSGGELVTHQPFREELD